LDQLQIAAIVRIQALHEVSGERSQAAIEADRHFNRIIAEERQERKHLACSESPLPQVDGHVDSRVERPVSPQQGGRQPPEQRHCRHGARLVTPVDQDRIQPRRDCAPSDCESDIDGGGVIFAPFCTRACGIGPRDPVIQVPVRQHTVRELPVQGCEGHHWCLCNSVSTISKTVGKLGECRVLFRFITSVLTALVVAFVCRH